MESEQIDPAVMSSKEQQEWFEDYHTDPRNLPRDKGLRDKLRGFGDNERWIPRWQRMSGLYPEIIDQMNPLDRRRRIRQLIICAKLKLRLELKNHEADPEAFERSIYWDPCREVCRQLTISRSRLSAFSQELTGLSLSELADTIKAETAPGRMRDALRAFFKSFLESHHKGTKTQSSTKKEQGLDRWEVWKALKASREAEDFCLGTWAITYGFASYTRFYRAFLISYHLTPHQVEMKLIDELLREMAPLSRPLPAGGEGNDAATVSALKTFPVWTAKELEQEIHELMPFEIMAEPWRVLERNMRNTP